MRRAGLSALVVCEPLQTSTARVQDHLRRQGLPSDDDAAARLSRRR